MSAVSEKGVCPVRIFCGQGGEGSKGVGRKFSKGAGNEKRPKNSSIKPLSTISVPWGREGRGPLPPATDAHGEEGFFRCRRPHFLEQKTSDFSKFMVFSHGQRGFEQVRIFFGQGGRGSIFRDFVWTSFMNRPLHKKWHDIIIWGTERTVRLFSQGPP